MALARDSVTNMASGGSGGTYTFSHTCTGSNLILFVVVEVGSSGTCTGVTYNGVAMSSIISANFSTSRNHYIFALRNPATGANNVVVSYNTAATCYAAAVSYTGYTGSANPNLTGTGTTSVSITSVVDNSAMIVKSGDNVSGAGSGSTSLTINNGVSLMESNPLLITPAGSKTMNITGADHSIGVVFAPSDPPTTTSSTSTSTTTTTTTSTTTSTSSSTSSTTSTTSSTSSTSSSTSTSTSTSSTTSTTSSSTSTTSSNTSSSISTTTSTTTSTTSTSSTTSSTTSTSSSTSSTSSTTSSTSSTSSTTSSTSTSSSTSTTSSSTSSSTSSTTTIFPSMIPYLNIESYTPIIQMYRTTR